MFHKPVELAVAGGNVFFDQVGCPNHDMVSQSVENWDRHKDSIMGNHSGFEPINFLYN